MGGTFFSKERLAGSLSYRHGPAEFHRLPAGYRALEITLNSFAFSKAGKKFYSWEKHRHVGCELIFVSKGSYFAVVNGKSLRLGKGDALLVQPGDDHEDRMDPGCEYFALEISVSARNPGVTRPIRLLGLAAPSDARILRRIPPEIFLLLKTALAFARGGGVGLRVAESRTQEIFWRVWSLVPKKNLSPEMLRSGELSDFSKRLSDLLVRFPDRRLTISEMARAFGWSESHFAHQCRALIGVTPAKAALHFRLERARELLLDSASGLREIALACGFASPFHFSRKFSLAFGASPLTWRKKYSKAIG